MNKVIWMGGTSFSESFPEALSLIGSGFLPSTVWTPRPPRVSRPPFSPPSRALPAPEPVTRFGWARTATSTAPVRAGGSSTTTPSAGRASTSRRSRPARSSPAGRSSVRALWPLRLLSARPAGPHGSPVGRAGSGSSLPSVPPGLPYALACNKRSLEGFLFKRVPRMVWPVSTPLGGWVRSPSHALLQETPPTSGRSPCA